jgi:hypothetical protein
MGTTGRGPVAVEVVGSADGMRAVDHASMAAEVTGGGLLLVAGYSAQISGQISSQISSHTGDLPVVPASRTQRDQARADLSEAVARVRRNIGHGMRVRTLLREGTRASVLAQAAVTARVLVVGRRRAIGPQRILAAHNDLLLASACDCAVVVVPESWRPSVADRTVYVGVHGTDISAGAVEQAFAAAATRAGGSVVVVHAERPRPGVDSERRWALSAETAVSRTLADCGERYPGVRVTRTVTPRPLNEALIKASRNAGLVVLGGDQFTGYVTRLTLAAAASPVAVVMNHGSTRIRIRETAIAV